MLKTTSSVINASQIATPITLPGNVTLSTGNIVMGTAGKGVDFSANTHAAGMTSELLNWYEEGTFTATLKGSVADPTTPVTTTGYYTRVGRSVFIQLSFENANTTGASGNVSVTGLPFANTASARAVLNVTSYSLATWTGQLFGLVDQSGTSIGLTAMASSAAWTNVTHNAGTARYLSITGTYGV